MNVRLIPVLLIAAFLFTGLIGCQQQGMTRPSSLDMDDNTVQFGVGNTNKGIGDIYVKLAAAYMREGQLMQAMQNAKRALTVEPSNAEGHNVIALLYDRLNEYDLAESHFKRALGYQPRNSYMLNAYGTHLCNRNRFDEADKLFHKALKNPLYKTPEVALTNAGVCAGRKPDMEQSESYLREALKHNPRLSVALIHMARISYSKGQFLSTRAYLQRYLEVAPNTASSLWLGIRTERELGDQDAVVCYSLLLRNSFPDSQEASLLKESIKR